MVLTPTVQSALRWTNCLTSTFPRSTTWSNPPWPTTNICTTTMSGSISGNGASARSNIRMWRSSTTPWSWKKALSRTAWRSWILYCIRPLQWLSVMDCCVWILRKALWPKSRKAIVGKRKSVMRLPFLNRKHSPITSPTAKSIADGIHCLQ